MRFGKHGDGLLRKMMEFPLLEIFKCGLDKFLAGMQHRDDPVLTL